MKEDEGNISEVMNLLTIQSERDSANPAHPNQLSLSNLPFEIKQNIVYWLDRIASEDESFSDDGSDVEELDDQEFTSGSRSGLDHKLSSKSTQKTTHTTSSATPSSTSDNETRQSDKKERPNLYPIHALSLVDRTFYELCRPLIWQDVDLEVFTLTKLRDFRSQVLVRQAEYVRALWWRSSLGEIQEYQPWKHGADKTEWDDELRSIELLGILESCKKVISVDIDLYCPISDDFLDKHDNFIKQDFTTWRFVEPVSKLTNLTAISLTAAGEIPFQELFLVRLIRDMNHLQSFTCCLVRADAPNIETSKSISTCQSPLALHLSSLRSLTAIDLDQTECFDMSWSTIEWQGALKSITLDDCSRATLRAIHKFCTKFSSSLMNLELNDIPSDEHTVSIRNDIKSGKYKFELPKLINLSITNELPICFLKLFEDSKRIEQIGLTANSEYNAHDIESIVVTDEYEGAGFSNLKKLVISLGDADVTMAEIEALELFYLSKGVALEFESEDDDDIIQGESDAEVDDSDDDDDSVGYQLEEEMEDEWREDHDEDEDEDEDEDDDENFD